MTLYEINQEMQSLIDVETGEIKDFDAFVELSLNREEKIANTIKVIKNLLAEATEIKAECDALKKRYESRKKNADRLKDYLSQFLDGETYSCPQGEIKYRKSKSVVVDDDFIDWAKENAPEILTYKEPAANLTEIRNRIESGIEIPHAEIIEKNNIQIK